MPGFPYNYACSTPAHAQYDINVNRQDGLCGMEQVLAWPISQAK